MSRVIIFVGPSLQKETVAEVLPDALILPPAEQSDVDFAARELGATVIGLVDGVHTQRLPVWHKEILGVLKEGVRVLGAASMGALRAVECEPWGSEPIGEIAGWYSSGYIDGDDEVCLAHGGEDTGWKQYSIPMVNVRATLMAMPIPQEEKDRIIGIAKGIYYPERTWRALSDACEIRTPGIFAKYAVDLKQADALHLMYTIAHISEHPRPKPERTVCNSDEGYGGVFSVNDAKIYHHGKIHRLHEIAPEAPFTQRIAIERKLALAFCDLAGICPREGLEAGSDLPDLDLSKDKAAAFWIEELKLQRAREWWSSSKAHFADVPATNDFLRAHGIYETRKESLQ